MRVGGPAISASWAGDTQAQLGAMMATVPHCLIDSPSSLNRAKLSWQGLELQPTCQLGDIFKH